MLVKNFSVLKMDRISVKKCNSISKVGYGQADVTKKILNSKLFPLKMPSKNPVAIKTICENIFIEVWIFD